MTNFVIVESANAGAMTTVNVQLQPTGMALLVVALLGMAFVVWKFWGRGDSRRDAEERGPR